MADFRQYSKSLQDVRASIEEKGMARCHVDTLERRGVYVDRFLNPSTPKDLKKIKFFARINKDVKKKFLNFELRNAEPETFWSGFTGRVLTAQEWDKMLGDLIKSANVNSYHSRGDYMFHLATQLSQLRFGPVNLPTQLLSTVEKQCQLFFLDSKFPLFAFMRDAVASDEKNNPKLYLWQGEADAIAYSFDLQKYVIVDFKVVDNLLDYCGSKSDLCGKHLHQCLVYAKLLQLHMDLPYLPPSVIVVIHKTTGTEGYFPLFRDYPKECYEKLDEYYWFTKQPPTPRRPLKISIFDKLLGKKLRTGEIPPDIKLKDLFECFNKNATVKDLLDTLDYDSLEIVDPTQDQ